MRVTTALFLLLITLASAHAQSPLSPDWGKGPQVNHAGRPAAAPEKVQTMDGRVLTLNPDGTFSIETPPTVATRVKVTKWMFEHNISRYGDETVRFMPVVRNDGTKDITGFKFTAVFKNAFNDEVFSFNGTSEERVKPKRTSTTRLFYSFKNNPFIPNEPYDKLLPLVVGGTANITVNVTSVAYADGTVAKNE